MLIPTWARSELRAPVGRAAVGELVVRINDEEAVRVPVYSDGDVPWV